MIGRHSKRRRHRRQRPRARLFRVCSAGGADAVHGHRGRRGSEQRLNGGSDHLRRRVKGQSFGHRSSHGIIDVGWGTVAEGWRRTNGRGVVPAVARPRLRGWQSTADKILYTEKRNQMCASWQPMKSPTDIPIRNGIIPWGARARRIRR